MPTIFLDENELNWLSRNTAKQVDILNSVDPDLTSDREKTLWAKLADKCNTESLEVKLSRHEIKEISAVVRARLMKLQGEVLPAYAQRQREMPEKSNFYQDYINRTKAAVEGLSGLLKKLEKAQ